MIIVRLPQYWHESDKSTRITIWLIVPQTGP